MEPGEYEALVARASTGNTSAATELLQFMRMHRIHQPEVVVLHGGRLLTSSQGRTRTKSSSLPPLSGRHRLFRSPGGT
jgi:hypothetical protein